MTNSTGSLDVLTSALNNIRPLVADALAKLEEAQQYTLDEAALGRLAMVRHGAEGANRELEKLLADLRLVAQHIDSAIDGCKRYLSLL